MASKALKFKVANEDLAAAANFCAVDGQPNSPRMAARWHPEEGDEVGSFLNIQELLSSSI
jgi:hypothetical protein